MLEKNCNFWEEPADAKCITTNGFIKKNGNGVMGAGIAGQAQRKFSFLPKTLGHVLQTCGNHVAVLHQEKAPLQEPHRTVDYISFPVKHNWFENADPCLIVRSAKELVAVADAFHYQKVLLPRPGCGNGYLKWDEVKPLIADILDDRFVAIHFNPFEAEYEG